MSLGRFMWTRVKGLPSPLALPFFFLLFLLKFILARWPIQSPATLAEMHSRQYYLNSSASVYIQSSSPTFVYRVSLVVGSPSLRVKGNPARRDKFQPGERLDAATWVMYFMAVFQARKIVLSLPLRGYGFYYFSYCRNNDHYTREDR